MFEPIISENTARTRGRCRCAVVCRPGVAGYAGRRSSLLHTETMRAAPFVAHHLGATAAKCVRVFTRHQRKARIAKRRAARLHRQRRASAGASPKRHSPEIGACPICLPDCPAPIPGIRMAYSMAPEWMLAQIPKLDPPRPARSRCPPRVLR